MPPQGGGATEMIAKVLFIADVQFGMPKIGDRFPIAQFTHVANVDLGDTHASEETVWGIVQNVDSKWMDDPRATLTCYGNSLRSDSFATIQKRLPKIRWADIGIRSMMIGDIVAYDDVMLMCGSVGWLSVQQEGDEYVLTQGTEE